MKKVLRVLLVFSLLAAISFLLPACQGEEGEEEKAPEGQLPVYQVGDKWVWSYVMDGTDYTLTEEITGEETVEGRDCYVLDMLFDPIISSTHDDVVYTTTGMKYWMDKDTALMGVKMETSFTGNGRTYTSSEIYSYDPWVNLFPLEIGKEAESELTTTQYAGGSQTGDPVVVTEKYKIDSREDITIAAGTFNCWKIIIYDGAGSVTLIMWYSDQIKSAVKMTDAEGNVMMELKSYSIG